MKKILFLLLFIFTLSPSCYALSLSAKSACVIAADTGEIIYSKDEKMRLPMASTTKIMTGLLAVEKGNMDDMVTVSQKASSQEGSSIYLRQGEKILLSDLLYGLMLNSGNDAAVAIAEHISGSTAVFAEEMTKKAKEIGASDTQFKNPNGLDEEGHYTTAYDLAIIGAQAMKNEDFLKVVSTKTASGTLQGGQVLYFKNHNKLLNLYDGAIGIKTGFTKTSGRCLVSAAQRDGVLLVAVTLSAPDDWNDHKKLLDYGFEKAYKKTVAREGQVLRTIHHNGEEYDFSAGEDIYCTSLSDSQFELRLSLPEKLPVPMAKGEKAGVGEVYFNDRQIKKFDIISAQDIPEDTEKYKKTFKKCIYRVFYSFARK